MKLHPSFPATDLDGTPWPSCEHHNKLEGASRILSDALAEAIIEIGIPKLHARAGEIVQTTWGCGRNSKMKTRPVMISCVSIGVAMDENTLNAILVMGYTGWWELDGETPIKRSGGACLDDFTTAGGVLWQKPPQCNEIWWNFNLEWVSPNTGKIEIAH